MTMVTMGALLFIVVIMPHKYITRVQNTSELAAVGCYVIGFHPANASSILLSYARIFLLFFQ